MTSPVIPPEGGKITVRVQKSDEKERDRLNGGGDSNGDILISVSDTGVGLKPDDIDRVFNPFEQVQNSMSKQDRERLLMIAFITLVLLYLNACSAYKQNVLTRQHQSVSKQTSTFNPAWFKDIEHMHAAIFFQVKNQ